MRKKDGQRGAADWSWCTISLLPVPHGAGVGIEVGTEQVPLDMGNGLGESILKFAFTFH